MFGVIKKPFMALIWERTDNDWFIIAEIRKINSLLHCKLPYKKRNKNTKHLFIYL